MKIDIYNISKKYDIVLADPPWQQRKGGKQKVRLNSSGVDLDYKTLELKDISDIMTKAFEISSENSILFLWTIEKYLFKAEDMAKNIGWKLHARMIWNKLNGKAPAFTIRFGHEYLLYMWKGKFTHVSRSERGKILSVFEERAVRHSQKPSVSYDIVERLYPNLSKLEMFARSERKGWDCWGDELD